MHHRPALVHLPSHLPNLGLSVVQAPGLVHLRSHPALVVFQLFKLESSLDLESCGCREEDAPLRCLHAARSLYIIAFIPTSSISSVWANHLDLICLRLRHQVRVQYNCAS